MAKSKLFSLLIRDHAQIAEQYLREGRKDKAAEAYARGGNFRQAAKLAAEAGDVRFGSAQEVLDALAALPEEPGNTTVVG